MKKQLRMLVLGVALAASANASADPAPASLTPVTPLLPKPAATCTHDHAEGEKSIGYCHALQVGDTLYISGVVGAGSMEEAVASVYGKLQATLRAHGLGFMHVVKENVYARDLDAFIAANGTRKDFYAGALPAATWVQVDRLFRPEYVLEVEVIATIPR